MVPDAAAAFYREQQQIGALTAATVKRLWARMGTDFDPSWAKIRPSMLQVVAAGQLAAATRAVPYVPAVLDETGQDGGDPVGDLNPAAFTGTASDGWDLGTLLDQAPITAKTAVAGGAETAAALAQAGRFLTMATLTQIADTRREVVAADIGRRPKVTGYVRMLNPPSCSRCAILAGKWYRWNEGFLRHPRCDCVHIPSTEDRAGDFRTDPYAYFRSLTEAGQEQVFGRSEARAIRDGGDIFRVVNVQQRGLAAPTSRQARRYGAPTRLTVDDIYRTAGTRANALTMLQQHGYITGPQTRTGNLRGQVEGFGQLGKGGRARAASDAVAKARAAGQRDPLNRYTMTAAERRLYDAKVRLDAAEQRGIWLNSVGQNSADRLGRAQPVTPVQLAILRRNYSNEVARARTSRADSVKTLARLLGVAL
jgi:hypothetical protein